MDQKEIDHIKHQATTSIIFLSLRNFGLQAVSFVGFFLLTLLLGTGEVGLFAIVAESVSILGYFSDVGLASALIQKKGEVTRLELQTTFFIQQILVFIAIITVAILYPQFSLAKGYGPKEMWILISLVFSFAAASLKTIPSVLLERQLNFKLISTVDIVENICFYFFAVTFAYLGFGAYSYAISIVIRSLVGLLIIYYFRPWPVGFAIDYRSIRSLFRYGIPFQLNSLIAMAKDRLANLLVAGIIGRESFGILSWAQKGPRLPLSFMDAIMRVTFPAFSRLQDNPELLRRSLNKTTFYLAFFIFPALTIISLVAPDIIHLIPKYSKWLPAITPLYFYSISFAIAAITTPLTNAFNAVGKINLTTKFMVMWTVLTWIFYPLLSLQYGYLGTAIAALIVGSSSLFVWLVADHLFSTNTLRQLLHPTIASSLILLSGHYLNQLSLTPLINLISKAALSTAIYLCYMFCFARSEIIWFISQIKCLFVKK